MGDPAMMTDWVSVLVCHLVRCPRTINRALDKVQPSDIAQVSSPDWGFVWHCSREYFRKYQKPIPLPFLMASLEERIRSDMYSDSEITGLCDFVGWVYDVKEDQLEPEEASRYMGRLLKHTRVSAKVEQMQQEGASIDDIYQHMQVGMQEASVGMSQAIDPFEAMDTLLDNSPPEPIGGGDVNYFNLLCNGGLRKGEILVALGPQGGFKTTLAVDLMCSLANVEMYSMLLGYEQSSIGGDVHLRFLARLSGIPNNRLFDKNFRSTITPEEKKKMADVKPYGRFLKWFDRTQAIDRVSDISGQVQELVYAGMKPELIILDQLSNWMFKWPEVCKNPDMFRILAIHIILHLKQQVCEKFGTRMIVLHQLAGENLTKNYWFKPKAGHAAEVKSVGNNADFVMCMGLLCKETSCFWACMDKARRGGGKEMILRAHAPIYHLSHAEDMVESPDLKGRFVRKGQENMVPRSNRHIGVGGSASGNL
jgi:hypothetical protein